MLYRFGIAIRLTINDAHLVVLCHSMSLSAVCPGKLHLDLKSHSKDWKSLGLDP